MTRRMRSICTVLTLVLAIVSIVISLHTMYKVKLLKEEWIEDSQASSKVGTEVVETSSEEQQEEEVDTNDSKIEIGPDEEAQLLIRMDGSIHSISPDGEMEEIVPPNKEAQYYIDLSGEEAISISYE